MYPSKALFFFLIGFLIYSCQEKKQENSSQSSLMTSDTVGSVQSEIETPRKAVQSVATPNSKLSPSIEENQADSTAQIEKEDEILSADFYQQLDKAYETFDINTNKDTTFKTSSGTLITIPSHSLMNNNMLVKGDIIFKVKEYLTKGDFLLANLVTSSNGQMLESGGMFHFEARTKAGEVCEVVKGKSVEVKVPQSKKTFDDMQLFYGQHDAHGKLDWQNSKAKVKRESEKSRLGVSQWRALPKPAILQKIISVKESGTLNQIYSDSSISSFDTTIRNSGEKIETLMIDFVLGRDGKLKKGTVYRNGKLLKRSSITFSYESNNLIKKVQHGLRVPGIVMVPVSSLNFKKTYDINLTTLDHRNHEFDIKPSLFEKTTFRGNNPDNYYHITMSCVFVEKDLIIPNWNPRYGSVEDLAKKIKDPNRNATAGEVTYYTFSTSQLSWINIDRFYHQSGEKAEILVINTKGADIKMVFNDLNSVLSPNMGFSGFKTIPVNENVTLIAIKMEEKIPYIAIRKMKTRTCEIGDLQFNPTTIEGIKKEFASL